MHLRLPPLRGLVLRGALGASAIAWGAIGGPAAFAHGAQGAHGSQGHHDSHESHAHALNAQTHLVHMPKGTATLAWNPTSHALTVSISMTGLAPNSSSPAQIQQGACDSGGAVVDALNPVAADAGGKGTSQTTLTDANVAQGMQHDWSIGVHSPTSGDLEACGKVHGPHHLRKRGHDPTMPQSETVALHGTNRPNQNVGGDAHLHLDNGTLLAKLNVAGLAPNSTHNAGIYQGTCASQGGLVHALDALHANAGGHATSTTSISGVTTIPSNGYVAVWADNGTDLLACGDLHGEGQGDKHGN
jgi:hypothetical protein